MAVGLRLRLLHVADRMLPAHLAVAESGHQFAKAHILAAMSELGVADVLGDEELATAEVAKRAGCDADAMHRLLRAAATFDAIRMNHAGVVRATRLTRTLRADDEFGAGAWCRYLSSAAHQQAWSDLARSVRTGDSSFDRVNGASLFEWFASHADEAANFDRGLAGLTLADAPFIIAALDLPTTGVVCDIAGGRGVLLAEILAQRPNLRGALVDTEDVLARAEAFLTQRGLRERVDLVAGDLFEPLQVKADLYLLKWILHDWNDEACTKLLAAISGGMPPQARLAIIDGAPEPNVVDTRFSNVDLEMLVVTDGGRERSVDHTHILLAAAGLAPRRLARTPTGLAIIEAAAA